ncbi:formyltransferase family protein [Lacinutrix salivirga]
MKIYCIGSNLESYIALKYLVSNNCKIDTLITLPSKKSEGVSDYVDLHEFCNQQNISVIDTTNVNSKATIETIKANQPDYLFTLGWSQIFKQDFINCFSNYIIGTHPSKLPYGRGRAPIPWTILDGLNSSAISFFKIDTGIDTGNIIFQREFKIPKNVYANELYSIVASELGKGFNLIYQKLISNTKINFKAQSEKGLTVRGKRTPADGLIDFSKTIDFNHKLIRAVSKPYPGAYCYYKDQKIIFWQVSNDSENVNYGTLGQIHKKSENGILVQFQDGNLWLNNPTNENEEVVDSKFFRIGDRLGYNIQDEIYFLRNKFLK